MRTLSPATSWSSNAVAPGAWDLIVPPQSVEPILSACWWPRTRHAETHGFTADLFLALGGNIFETTSFLFVKSGRDCEDTQAEDGWRYCDPNLWCMPASERPWQWKNHVLDPHFSTYRTILHCQLALPEGIPKTSEPWLVGWVPLFHLIKVINNPI